MRLHAVITPPSHVVADLAEAVEQASRLAPGAPWLSSREWQLKLAYFGNLGLSESVAVRQTLGQIGSYCPPLGLRVVGAEALPEDERAESLVVGLGGDIEELWSLAAAVPSMVQRHGLFLDRRSFRASITVAQEVRGPFDARAAASELATYQGPPWTAEEMCVVRWVPGGDDKQDAWEDVERYRFTAPREDVDQTAGDGHVAP